MDAKNVDARFAQSHEQLRKHLSEMAQGRDLRGIEINRSVHWLANCYETAISQSPGQAELSGPRLGILMRLMGEEFLGNRSGIKPTQLSHFQGVSKNTISALLRGLEEKKYIERAIDPSDKRAFLIRITDAGRELIERTTPDRLDTMNRLASGLSTEEQDTLLALLQKLRTSIHARSK